MSSHLRNSWQVSEYMYVSLSTKVTDTSNACSETEHLTQTVHIEQHNGRTSDKVQ